MPKTKNVFIMIGLIGAVIFICNFWSADLVLGDDVTVSATVSETVSCAASTTTTAFGTLTTTAVSTSTPDVTITMSCNYASGCTLKVQDDGNATNPGLYSTTVAYLIGSADAAYADTATLAAGTEGYGIQGSTNANGSGGTLTIATRYNQTGNAVGGFEITDQSISSSTEPIANRETVVKHKAAISGLTKAATNYSDILTYSCTGN